MPKEEIKGMPEPDVQKGWGDSVTFDPDRARTILPDAPPPPPKDQDK